MLIYCFDKNDISKSKFGGNINAYIVVFIELMLMVLLATVSVKYHTVSTTKRKVKAARNLSRSLFRTLFFCSCFFFQKKNHGHEQNLHKFTLLLKHLLLREDSKYSLPTRNSY